MKVETILHQLCPGLPAYRLLAAVSDAVLCVPQGQRVVLALMKAECPIIFFLFFLMAKK
jgi:hypothetical protein